MPGSALLPGNCIIYVGFEGSVTVPLNRQKRDMSQQQLMDQVIFKCLSRFVTASLITNED